MKTKAICLIGIIFLALLAGLALAGGQQGQTLDSLNMRCIFQFHGDDYLSGLAMAPDTTLWTCYSGTDTLIQIDASDPDAIDTNFFAIDSILNGIADVIQDTILIAMSWDGTDQGLYSININTSPPEVVSHYKSPHLCFWGISLDEPWIVVDDSILVTAERSNSSYIALFDLSDVTNIDTFSTNTLMYGISSHFSVKDSILYITWCSANETEPPYHLKTWLSVMNIANPYNPIHETHLYAWHWDNYHPEVAIPSVASDSFLFLAANYEEMVIADVYNISDPTAPVYVGQLGPNTNIAKYCMIYENDYLYAGAWIKDMQGYPDTDSLVGYAVGAPRWMEACGKYLYRITGASFVAFEFYEFDTTRQAINETQPPRDTWEEMFLSPNPAYQMCNVRLNCPSYGNISIYNVLGQKVKELETTPFRKQYSISFDNEPNGLYLVTFHTGDKIITKKVVIIG